MPTYEYRCRNCGESYTRVATISEYGKLVAAHILPPSCRCGHWMKRVYTPPATPKPSFEPGFNQSFGRHFDTRQQLIDHAQRESAARTERTGIEHEFALHDGRDLDFAQSQGVTDEGMDATRARKRETGLTDRSTFG